MQQYQTRVRKMRRLRSGRKIGRDANGVPLEYYDPAIRAARRAARREAGTDQEQESTS